MMAAERSVTEAFVRAVAETIVTIVDDELASPLGEVWRKNDTEPVTATDLRIEARLANALRTRCPKSTVVGEEEAHRSPNVLARLASRRPVWLIDPIDGTSSFIDGAERFSTLVSLCLDGQAVASWTYAPKLATMMTATTTSCLINGVAQGARPPCASDVVVITNPVFWTGTEADLEHLIGATFTVRHCDGVGIEYIDLACGRTAGAVFTWNKPWDHVAGLLAVAAAGGCNSTNGIGLFTPNGPNPLPLVAGTTEAVQILLDLIGESRRSSPSIPIQRSTGA